MSAKSQIQLAIEKLETQARALETEAAGLRKVIATLHQQQTPKSAEPKARRKSRAAKVNPLLDSPGTGGMTSA